MNNVASNGSSVCARTFDALAMVTSKRGRPRVRARSTRRHPPPTVDAFAGVLRRQTLHCPLVKSPYPPLAARGFFLFRTRQLEHERLGFAGRQPHFSVGLEFVIDVNL